ncbi:MAG: sortase [Patescibacteria group bacterium]
MKFVFSLLLLGALLFIPKTVFSVTYKEPPTQIIIPSLKLSLPVHTAKVLFNTWEVHLDGASFGDGTTIPGNKGNTVIFSHARIGLFGDLTSVKKGDLVHVLTGKDWFVYRIYDTFVVDPRRIDILEGSDKYELTLYTCTGTNWSQRFIVKASLLSNPSRLEK